MAVGGGGGEGYTLNRQNPLLLSVMKVIFHCWWSLRINFFVLNFPFSFSFFFVFSFLFFFFDFFLFRIFFIWIYINQNLFFLEKESLLSWTGNLLTRWWSLSYSRKSQDKWKMVEDIHFPGILNERKNMWKYQGSNKKYLRIFAFIIW